MKTQFGTGIAVADDGYAAGHDAASEAAAALGTERVDFCQVFASARYDYEAVLDGIDAVITEDTIVIGCSSSGEFTEDSTTNGSVAVSLVTSDSLQFFAGLGTGLSDNVTGCLREATRDLPRSVDGYPFMTAIVLHDGLVGVGEQIAMVAQSRLGPNVSLAGGSAGDDMEMDETVVFCNGEIESNAVVVGLIAATDPPVVTVNHGHEPLSEPMTVTEADGSVVTELDGEPAFEKWLTAIRDHAKGAFGVDVDTVEPGSRLLTKLLTRYEFGIDQGRAYKIRWPGPTTTTEGPIHFAVDIPEGTVVRVMESPHEEQINAVRDVAREAREKMGEQNIAGGFVYDCVCRSVILEDEFDRAVEGMRGELNVPLAGFETYGELCMERGQTSGYHNTTAVVLLLPK